MISISRLCVQYGSHAVLQNVDLELAAGIHGIVGLNGSGKTTLLNALAGIIRPDGGSIAYGGRRLTESDVGFLETNSFFYSRITGREYLELFRMANPAFRPDDWNRLFELPLDRLVDGYSTGMRKKLAFMGVICLDRPVLILDEPYNGVDLESYRKMQGVIRMLQNESRVILVTSHVLESLTSLCDRIHHLQHGQIAFSAGRESFDGLESRLFEAEDQKNARLIRELMKGKGF